LGYFILGRFHYILSLLLQTCTLSVLLGSSHTVRYTTCTSAFSLVKYRKICLFIQRVRGFIMKGLFVYLLNGILWYGVYLQQNKKRAKVKGKKKCHTKTIRGGKSRSN
jgi:hypothetical protein